GQLFVSPYSNPAATSLPPPTALTVTTLSISNGSSAVYFNNATVNNIVVPTTVNGPGAASAGTTLSLGPGGTLGGSGTVYVASATWAAGSGGGSLSGSGTTVVTGQGVPAGQNALTLSGNWTLDSGYHLTSQGSALWQAGGGNRANLT